MKALVIGNRFEQMATFGENLGDILSIDQVRHLGDLAVNRPDQSIVEFCEQDNWVIVGNAKGTYSSVITDGADIIYSLRTPDSKRARQIFGAYYDQAPWPIGASILHARRDIRHIYREHLADSLDLMLGNADESGTTRLEFRTHEAADRHLWLMRKVAKRSSK